MIISRLLITGCLACICCETVLLGADDTEPAMRRPLFGFRIEYLATPLFKTHYATGSTTNPAADFTYTATTHTPRMTPVPFVEYRLSSRISLRGELEFRHAQYQQVALMRSGIVNPNAGGDDRPITTIRETNTPNYWQIPVIVSYYGLGRTAWLHRAFVSGGAELRHVGKVRTGTEYSNADGTYDYNENPTLPQVNNQVGFVASAGLRFRPHFPFKWHIPIGVTPEVSFVRWEKRAFQGPAYYSTQNQLEGGIGFSF
jgi:hypothetical protein